MLNYLSVQFADIFQKDNRIMTRNVAVKFGEYFYKVGKF